MGSELDMEWVRDPLVDNTERPSNARRRGSGRRSRWPEDRSKQLMQTGEGEIDLRFDSNRRQRPHARGDCALPRMV